jgi:hypothetical protein
MDFKNLNPNSENVLASNLESMDFTFFENYKDQAQKAQSKDSFLYRWLNFPWNVFFHIFHFTNQNGMNNRFLCMLDLWHKSLLFKKYIFEGIFCVAHLAHKCPKN